MQPNSSTAPTSGSKPLAPITLSLAAPQADALEDAIKTFLPADQRPTVGSRKEKGLGAFYKVTFTPEQLPQLVDAATSYVQQICNDRTTRGVLTMLQVAGMQNGGQA